MQLGDNLPLVPILSQINPAQNFTLLLFKPTLILKEDTDEFTLSDGNIRLCSFWI
jgi:hypothetical protein